MFVMVIATILMIFFASALLLILTPSQKTQQRVLEADRLRELWPRAQEVFYPPRSSATFDYIDKRLIKLGMEWIAVQDLLGIPDTVCFVGNDQKEQLWTYGLDHQKRQRYTYVIYFVDGKIVDKWLYTYDLWTSNIVKSPPRLYPIFDELREQKLKVGVSSEADVRKMFGQPDRVDVYESITAWRYYLIDGNLYSLFFTSGKFSDWMVQGAL